MISLNSITEADTKRIGTDIAMALQPGDMLLLSGDLGTGKTCLARSIIRTLSEIDDLEVPSPTYTICQDYAARIPVYHLDLYRLSGMEELEELGWQEFLEDGVILAEWPENCFPTDPDQAVRVSIEIEPDNSRGIKVSGNAELLHRIMRSIKIRNFLEDNNLQGTDRRFLSGDASARAYELVNDGKSILMNSPAMPDGPPIRDGKPYSQIAHLAEDVSAFIAIGKILESIGTSVPEVYASNLEEGFLLIENLGSDGIIDENRSPITERYRAAVELLAHLHVQGISRQISLAENLTHYVPDYDRDAMMIEVELLMDWFVPDKTSKAMDRKEFETLWDDLITKLEVHPKSIVLRDYHSPNIIWLGNRTGIRRVGAIDYQDAMIGPLSYDLASLAQDARVDISEQLEVELVDHYIALRHANTPNFDEEQFREGYAIMAAQRATKILGIFVRLDLRDSKPQYRAHIPRILEYLGRSIKHPVLSRYRNWLSDVIKL